MKCSSHFVHLISNVVLVPKNLFITFEFKSVFITIFQDLFHQLIIWKYFTFTILLLVSEFKFTNKLLLFQSLISFCRLDIHGNIQKSGIQLLNQKFGFIITLMDIVTLTHTSKKNFCNKCSERENFQIEFIKAGKSIQSNGFRKQNISPKRENKEYHKSIIFISYIKAGNLLQKY